MSSHRKPAVDSPHSSHSVVRGLFHSPVDAIGVITPDEAIPDNVYFRPDGVSLYFRPDGESLYLRPE